MKSKKFNVNFFKEETPEMFYVLGFFFADGSLVKNKQGGCYFSLQTKDKQILIAMKKALGSEHKISERKDIRTDSVFYRLQIGSKSLYEDLKDLGLSGNKTKNLPCLNISAKNLAHFVRGYFDGDGNVWYGIIHKSRKTQHNNILLAFTSGSFDFLQFLKINLSFSLDVTGSLFKGASEYYRLQYSKSDALKIYDFMYNTYVSDLFLKRKKKQFDSYIKHMRL